MAIEKNGLPTGRGPRAHARHVTADEVAVCRGWLADAGANLPRGQRRTLRFILVITEERRTDWNQLARREIRHYTGLSQSGQDKALKDLAEQKRLVQRRPAVDTTGGSAPNEYRLTCLDPEAEKRDETSEEELVANAAR